MANIRTSGAIAKTVWDQKKVYDRAKRQVVRGATEGAIYARNRVRAEINRRNSTGKRPSKPGEPPKRVTGQLRKNIWYHVNETAFGVQAYVGGKRGSDHVIFRHEFGEHKRLPNGGYYRQKPRPFLRATIVKYAREIGLRVAGVKRGRSQFRRRFQ